VLAGDDPLRLVLEDSAPAFDPTAWNAKPDLTGDIAERPIGRAGIALVMGLASSARWEALAPGNRLTLELAATASGEGGLMVDIEETVRAFDAARERGEYFPAAWFDKLSLDDAFRLQLARIRRRQDAPGQRRVGWKVGLTAQAIQQQFGVHEPVFGCLLAEGRKPSGQTFRAAELIKPGFENEVLIELGRDVPPGADRAAVAAAVATLAPALEIIETRGDFTRQLALALADNAQQKAFVVGTPVRATDVGDLTAVTARVRINGAEVATGTGDAVLGHPYNSVAWLAGKLAQFGEALRAGDVIMSGSFTRQFPLAAGDAVETVFDGLGSVTARVV
jgi:2-keto-4-pentenoate hydratase